MARFDGKVVLISGGARGQGAAEARLLVKEGAKVVIGDVLEEQGKALASELGTAAAFVRHDVTSEGDWDRAVKAAEGFGALHGLVNNAGIYQPKSLMETDSELWERHIRINQFGCFLGMKAVVPAMERRGGGSIVNISSAGIRLQRHEMGAARHDKVGRHGPRAEEHPRQLGASGTDRHRDAERAHGGAERGAAEDGADEAAGHGGRGRPPGAVPAVGRERLHHRRRGGDRRRRDGVDGSNACCRTSAASWKAGREQVAPAAFAAR
jgi:hypothetical protein